MRKHLWWLALGCLAAVAVVGCGPDGVSEAAGSKPSVTELYQAALKDAEVAEASEVVDTLVAIVPENSELTRDAAGRVLMETWTSYTGYDDKIGVDTELGADVWTMVAPQMQAFCRKSGLAGEALSLRLEQLIGLPPGAGYDRVAELWVPPEAVFRPSPDPEITDTVASLDFPADAPEAHIQWINDLKATSYSADGYPWTRLGYTYDWNPDGKEVGLSEFVVRKGATVGVKSVTVTGEYCKGAP